MKRILSVLIAIILLISAIPMSITVNAAAESDLEFTLNADGESYSVKAKSDTISGELVIPSIYNDLPVTRIGNFAFFNCSTLKSITIPNSVTSIGDRTFSLCTSLQHISIPSSVTRIGLRTFSDCSSLKNITIPYGVQSIGNGAFWCCASLESIVIPDSVITIENYAFSSCYVLQSVWYTGTSSKKNNISIGSNNRELKDATWHYNICKDTHTYSEDCDATCNKCEWKRTTITPHIFSADCDNTCNTCNEQTRTVNITHAYSSSCDAICNLCNENTRTVNVPHMYYVSFDTQDHFRMCDDCGYIIEVKPHKFDSACDTTCNCGYVRTITHDYKATFDADNHFDRCTVCGDVVNVKAHEFENNCDTTCDCGYERTITHSYGEYVYNNDATTQKDGTKTRTCSICGDKQTVTAEGTKIQPNPFKDVKKSDFYYTPVLWAVSNGITSGTSKTTFAPNEACTRGQIATFLWRAAGCPTPKTSKNPFTDVKKSDYYYKAVLWAVGEGITSGTSKTTFGPNEACTRGQIATFLWRANGGKKVSASNPFKDVKKSDYYYNAVLWAVKNKITSGTSATTFSPNEACTRGQIATFLYRNYN